MTDNSNGWHFKRGLGKDFMRKLEPVAKQGGWFADALADPDLILGIRHNYLNVYWHGQSLFKIEGNGTGPLKFSTHPKYLVDPGLSREVKFDGLVFQVAGHEALATNYSAGKTLRQMKRSARLYSGGEKDGVHAVVRAPANPNVIDTEVAFNSEAEGEDELSTQRIDLAFFEEVKGKIRLRFWEAKLYSNPELSAAGDTEAPVVEQVRRYRKLIEKHREEIVESYRRVAGNLVEMIGWVDSKRKVGESVQRVAAGEPVTIDDPPFVGLIIYGYDDAQWRSKRWKAHLGKLDNQGIFIRSAGDAKNIKLRGADFD